MTYISSTQQWLNVKWFVICVMCTANIEYIQWELGMWSESFGVKSIINHRPIHNHAWPAADSDAWGWEHNNVYWTWGINIDNTCKMNVYLLRMWQMNTE